MIEATSLRTPMRIGGRDVVADAWIDVTDPSDRREVVGQIPRGSAEDVAAAAAAAAAAFPEWAARTPAERSTILRSGASALLEDADRRAELLSRENGKVLAEAQWEVRGCSSALNYYADLGESFEYEEELPSPNGRVLVVKEPVGVTAVIVPWNSPAYLTFLAISPALIAGNTVVVKPPSEAPLALMDSLRVIERFLPDGVLNVVTGPGGILGPSIATDPHIRKISFTGSVEAGRETLRIAADSIKRVTLELGGNDPAVVFHDADVDVAAPELVKGVYALSGQVCYNVKRIYVHRSRFDDFVDRFTADADKLVVGRGLQPGVTMGPLINERQLGWVSGLIDDARRSGATVSVVGTQHDGAEWTHGNYLRPAVVTGVDQSASIVRCEQFGPVVPIIPFDTEDEAIALANDSHFGLASSVWTRDEERGLAMARRIEAGTTFVNVHRLGASGVDMPFGGVKESGLGRSHGWIALEEQFETHTVSTRHPSA